MMKTKISMALAVWVGLCTVASSAWADPPKKEEGYGYDFKDDKLLGADIAGTIPKITVLNRGRRDILHRPRTQFVPEMLKSIENM
jgi:hypothetical protein